MKAKFRYLRMWVKAQRLYWRYMDERMPFGWLSWKFYLLGRRLYGGQILWEARYLHYPAYKLTMAPGMAAATIYAMVINRLSLRWFGFRLLPY